MVAESAGTIYGELHEQRVLGGSESVGERVVADNCSREKHTSVVTVKSI